MVKLHDILSKLLKKNTCIQEYDDSMAQGDIHLKLPSLFMN